MRIIQTPTMSSLDDLQAWREVLAAPQETIDALKKATAEAGEAAAKAAVEAEKARQDKAAAEATIIDANAIMAGAKKGQADLETEKQALAAAIRDHKQRGDNELKRWTEHRLIQDEREKALERREVALRAREEKLAAREAEVSALKAEYEAKIGNLKKLVA